MRQSLLATLCYLLATASVLLGAPEGPWFVDATESLGVSFHHQDGRSGEKFYVESAASGGGWFDADGDGDLDLYLINGAATPGSSVQGTPRNALYENRDGRFVDISEAAGVGDESYGMGLCVGDVDADGRLDFLVTNYGPDRLYRGLGSGRFEEIAARAGVDDPRWGASCAFGDLDGDGDLDLYVTHYVDFRFDRNPFCGDRARNLRAYCRPEAFDGVTDSLFINQGDGSFREEGQSRGIARGANEKGFGVVLSDIDDDKDLDIYVTNDGTMNRLYINDGKGRFSDIGLLSGVGLSVQGRAQSGMGVDIADFDGDQRLDVVVTNYSMESNALYRSLARGQFDEESSQRGLAGPSFRLVGWGTRFFDVDNDGDLDLAVANGHAVDNIEIFEAKLTYEQPNQLLLNDGRGYFTDASQLAGEPFQRQRVSRALAVGDFNDDGRLDLLITNTNGSPEVLRNELTTGNHWLGVHLKGPASNPLAIGARVTLSGPGDRHQLQEVRSGGSFLAQSDLRLHFGLGREAVPVKLEIRWPNGEVQRAEVEELDRYVEVAYSPAH
ncbi:MAG: CRTAC1 family protein [Thermoanaerobaculia bacterium]|nr:CRTAC1 family protein [Thermoanaerobaculia bacterium]